MTGAALRPDAAGGLLTALRDPSSITRLAPGDWDLLLRQARRAKLLPRLAYFVQDLAIVGELPEKVRDRLSAAEAMAEQNALSLRWEANRIGRALSELDIPIVLLKGAAYVLAELPAARGRLATDIDIMVPEVSLEIVKARLQRHGWEEMELDPYDQQYYRRWMHELPPLRHRERGTVLDVHHTILPRTSRLAPDPRRLWEEARKLSKSPFYTLSPEDMVLHSAAHLFHDGDLRVAIRDLVDIDNLLRYFGQESDFWRRLVPRARQIDLARPLFYALRYATVLLHTPVPKPVLYDLKTSGPNRATQAIMDRLVPQVLLPGDPNRPDQGARTAAMALYIRSHWLRMPPWLLIAHLSRKALKRLTRDEPGTN